MRRAAEKNQPWSAAIAVEPKAGAGAVQDVGDRRSMREAWLSLLTVDLTSAEFDLLWLLARQRGQGAQP